MIQQLDEQYVEQFNTTFTKHVGLGKPQKEFTKLEKRNLVKSVTKDIENQLTETCVER